MYTFIQRLSISLLCCLVTVYSACSIPQASEPYRVPNVVQPALYPHATLITDHVTGTQREIVYDSVEPCTIVAVWYVDTLPAEGWKIYRDDRPRELEFEARSERRNIGYGLVVHFDSQNSMLPCRVTYIQWEQGPY